MARWFRSLLETLQALAQALLLVAERLADTSGEALTARILDLENSRGRWEGEMEGLLTKVEARFNAARAAEERTRHLNRRTRGEDDEEADLGADAEALARQLAAAHAQGSGTSGVLPMPEAVAHDPRSAIRARKWGRA